MPLKPNCCKLTQIFITFPHNHFYGWGGINWTDVRKGMERRAVRLAAVGEL